jgi:NAD(P)-dependent dehydrogenase (short-subunit alcohol dehydrogenase family)
VELASSHAVITGGGSGLGEATARRLAAAGARLSILDRDMDKAGIVAKAVNGTAYDVDVTREDDVSKVVQQLSKDAGPPKILVNCAGIGRAARIIGRDGALSIDLFQQTVQVNLIGSYIMMSHVAREMMAQAEARPHLENGVIINTASVAYEDGQLGQAAYSASKGGIASLSLPAAREFSKFGIRVMAIAPGLFETAMTETLPDDIRATISAQIPYPQRLGFADEYAQLAEQIITNPYLNGTTIRLDGAMRLPPR